MLNYTISTIRIYKYNQLLTNLDLVIMFILKIIKLEFVASTLNIHIFDKSYIIAHVNIPANHV